MRKLVLMIHIDGINMSRKVDHNPTLDRGGGSHIVSPASNRNGQTVLASVAQRFSDVIRAFDEGNDRCSASGSRAPSCDGLGIVRVVWRNPISLETRRSGEWWGHRVAKTLD